MTGRELIVYILQNGLEDADIFGADSDKVFMTETEAAVLYNVGTATIRGWIGLGMITGFKIGEAFYILRNAPDPRKE